MKRISRQITKVKPWGAEISGSLAEEMREGESVLLGILVYEPGNEKLSIRCPSGRSCDEVFAIVSKFVESAELQFVGPETTEESVE